MPWPTIFANLAAGVQPLSLFDTMFTQVAQMCAIPCTAAGTNALTLTPIGSAPTFTSYQNFTTARFIAVANSTGAMTAQFGALAFLNVYLGDLATQAGSGAVNLGQEYVLVFVQSLNAGAGGFVLEQASVPGAGTGFAPNAQSLTSGTTYTTPTAGGKLPLYLYIRMVGGGGGGGGDTAGTGGTGGTTSFSTTTAWTVIGGTGGGFSSAVSTPGAGGAGGTGGVNGSPGSLVVRLIGANGNTGEATSSGGSSFGGGDGGGTPLSGRGAAIGGATGGTAVANSGSGGAGAGSTAVRCGGGGGASEYVEFIVPSPAASYTYAIGAAGTAGAGGTNSGGAGAGGQIQVIAYWQ